MLIQRIVLILILAISQFSLAAAIDPTTFFQSIQGDYRILSSGLNAPKGGTEQGYVALEETEGLIVMPYCHVEGGVCDPGFRSFPLNQTQIQEEKTELGSQRFALKTIENGSPREFFWEIKEGEIHFFDPDYTLVSGDKFPLEFVIERIQ